MKNNEWHCDDYDEYVLLKNIPLGGIYYIAPWAVVKGRNSGILRLPDSSPSFCCAPYPYGPHEMAIRRDAGEQYQYVVYPKKEHLNRFAVADDDEIADLPIVMLQLGRKYLAQDIVPDGTHERLERLEKKIDVLLRAAEKDDLDAIVLRLNAVLSHIGGNLIDGTHPDSILGRLERIEEAEERFNHVSHLLSILGPLIAVGMCSILQKKAPWAVKAEARDLLAFARDVADAELGAMCKEKHGERNDELP